jgi:heme exporter protein D
MNEGIIREGWPFVWAAYGVSALILVGYATSVFLRLRSVTRRRVQVNP